MTIFCSPLEMQPAPAGGEPILSGVTEVTEVSWRLEGLASATLTSRRILGNGPSLEAEL